MAVCASFVYGQGLSSGTMTLLSLRLATWTDFLILAAVLQEGSITRHEQQPLVQTYLVKSDRHHHHIGTLLTLSPKR